MVWDGGGGDGGGGDGGGGGGGDGGGGVDGGSGVMGGVLFRFISAGGSANILQLLRHISYPRVVQISRAVAISYMYQGTRRACQCLLHGNDSEGYTCVTA